MNTSATATLFLSFYGQPSDFGFLNSITGFSCLLVVIIECAKENLDSKQANGKHKRCDV